MFSIFKKKQPIKAQPIIKAEPVGTPDYRAPEFVAKLKNLLTTSRFVYRDVSLPPEIVNLYKLGSLFRERTFCDSTAKFGGICGNLRFLIVSPSPKSLGNLSQNPEWGMCMFPLNQLFKVIDICHDTSKTQITLLHVPEEFAIYFRSEDSKNFEQLITPHTRADFEEACKMEPLSALNNANWLERTSTPLGVNNKGELLVE